MLDGWIGSMCTSGYVGHVGGEAGLLLRDLTPRPHTQRIKMEGRGGEGRLAGGLAGRPGEFSRPAICRMKGTLSEQKVCGETASTEGRSWHVMGQPNKELHHHHHGCTPA